MKDFNMQQGLYLIAPAGTDENELIKRFNRFCAGEIPDALLFDPTDRSVESVRRFAQTVQGKNVALILKNDIDLALKLPADGVQIPYQPDIKKIRQRTTEFSLGVLCATRDEAMRAGEAGADYIGFDASNAAELTQWWSELFTVPCVNFNPDRPSPAADFRTAVLAG